eukprot:367353-Ditylum_brightwellii.AAC.1
MHMSHIIHAILNLAQRELVAQQTLRNAEEYDYLHDSQYRDLKGHSAIDIPMLDAFILDVSHLMKANVALTDCNAKTCYDRIVAIITSLVEYKAGLPADACILLEKALKQMKYTMITAYGTLVLKNKHGPGNPLHGIGQGPTDAPAGYPTKAIVPQQNAKQFVADNKLARNGE